MSSCPPLVVAILHSDADDIDYQLYCEAYGIEMQVDNEWNAEAVLLAPYDHLYAVTKNTDVTGEDAAIVSAGATDIPISDDGSPEISVIKDSQNNWLLVGDPRLHDTDEIIHRKLQTALDAGCRVIICITDTTHDHIAARINGLASIDCSRIVIALVHSDAPTPNVAASVAESIRDQIASIGATGRARFIVAGNISGDNAAEIVDINGVDGVLLMDDKYDDFGTILEVLDALDHHH
ncbi:MAG: triose-phosphate isomerase [Pirellulaceae bacterium]